MKRRTVDVRSENTAWVADALAVPESERGYYTLGIPDWMIAQGIVMYPSRHRIDDSTMEALEREAEVSGAD